MLLLLHHLPVPSFYPFVHASATSDVNTHDLKSAKTASWCSSSFPTPRLQEIGSQASSSSRLSCTNDENAREASFKGFSVLGSDVPWDSSSAWSTFTFYLFSLHIPLSFGGLSVVAHVLQRPVLDPQTEAGSLLAIQVAELVATLLLLKSTASPSFRLKSFFGGHKLENQRSTWVACALGFCALILLVFLASLLSDLLLGPKAVNNPVLKGLLQGSDLSRAASVLVCCVVTPFLEELVYRGFLLTTISSTLKWHQAVLLSSIIFSAAHFSAENSLQLFIVGCILGCSYCWTGELTSSFLIHSLYNAMILFFTYTS